MSSFKALFDSKVQINKYMQFFCVNTGIFSLHSMWNFWSNPPSQYGLYNSMMHRAPGGNIHTSLTYLILSILLFCAFTNITHRVCIKQYIQIVKCCNIGKKGFFYPRFSKFILK